MSDVLRGPFAGISPTDQVGSHSQKARIRVTPNSYIAVLFLATFFTAFFVYLGFDSLAAGIFLASWIFVPILYWGDRIVFDGENLRRTGFLSRLWNRVNHFKNEIEFRDIEQIETQALRAFRRGGKIFYRYRTSIRSRNQRFSFASGGEDFRKMVALLFSRVADDVLDTRSIELRDYLRSPKETHQKLQNARIPSSEVLENSLNEFETGNRQPRQQKKIAVAGAEEKEKANSLRQLANELRLSGNLLQALEAFRRALYLNPKDAWLLFEFGRCLHSYAGFDDKEKIKHRANAVLRLAEIRAGADAELLSRLGESYFQYGDWNRAGTVFRKALAGANESFRSLRGLAEIALREGKIAHVIHHFAAAFHLTETAALKRFTIGETAYFTRLNENEDYLEAEIKRINWLDGVQRGKKMALRFALFGSAIILVGIAFDELVANTGWAIASVSLLLWIGFIFSGKFLAERTPLSEFD